MKRVFALLLSAVLLTGAVVATHATPEISEFSDAKISVDFEDGQDRTWTQSFTLESAAREYQLFANPKKNYDVTNETQNGNRYLQFKRARADTKSRDGYFDVYYYEPTDANRTKPWGAKYASDRTNPVYDHVVMLSYDVRFVNTNDSLAVWNVGNIRFNSADNKFFTFTLKFNKDQIYLQPNTKEEYVGEAKKELSLDRWYNFTLVFNMLEGNKYYTASLYIDDAYVGTVKYAAQAQSIARTQTTFGFDASSSNVTADSVVSVDNVFFGVLPDNSALTPAAIESIDDAVKIDCSNENHEQTAPAEATSKLLPGTYTFKMITPSTALVTLTDLSRYYALLGGDHAGNGSDNAVTTAALRYENGKWVLDTAAQLYVTCDATAPVNYTVTYDDGCRGYAFPTQKHTVTKEYNQPDPATPVFAGVPQRAGYQFIGWTPAVAKTVTGDVTYTAVWKEIVIFRPALGSAMLTVTDTDGAPLAGAKFELHRVASNGTDTVLGTFTTGKNGRITLYANPKANTGLSPNSSYYWKQIEAPTGYKIAGENLPFAARYGSTAKLTLVNEKN